ncbi:MAG: Lrp/AsnC family transcriptional regulator [Parasphingorhabdus sp.]|uniref:Lrp/AsnC family transcriptional regulator n=1 Tax=Parasphingorhabdus sp. TaxID=2709688 RepID=UPI00329911BD
MKRQRHQTGPLDATDAQILELLVGNARLSLAELARKVGLSAPSVSERLKRLEEEEVIQSYTAIMNPVAIGLSVSAYIRIQPVPGKMKKVLAIVEGLEEIVRCDRVTGGDCYIARAHVQSVGDLEALVDELSPFAMTDTSIIQSTPVPYRLPAFPIDR